MCAMGVTVDPHVARMWIETVADASIERREDELAIEEPLEIRVDGEPLAVTMRTPGEDEPQPAGLLAGEGLIAGRSEADSVGPPAAFAANTVEVRTTRGLRRDPRDERRFYLTSSCPAYYK